jgi:hypothetical protein
MNAKLRKILALLILVSLGSLFAESTKPKQSFVIAPVKNGTYTPWRDRKEAERFYAGETIEVSGTKFHYVFFTDALQEHYPDWTGRLQVFPDHIFLDHPGIAYPHRITGYLDGKFVMVGCI